MDRSVFALKYSGAGAGFVLVAGTATLALVAAMPLPTSLRILLSIAVGLAMIDNCRRHALRVGPRATLSFVLEPTGEIEVRTTASVTRGLLRDGCFVAPWLTIIRWRPAGAFLDRTIVVLPDMLTAEAFRALRVFLRWR